MFTAIEASHSVLGLVSYTNLGKKGYREVRKLSCLINYDANSDNASRDRVKGRAVCDYFLKPYLIS